jgi:hypothetical protein
MNGYRRKSLQKKIRQAAGAPTCHAADLSRPCWNCALKKPFGYKSIIRFPSEFTANVFQP